MKIQAPAVFSGKEALKKAMTMKSFMEEKILAGQIQSKINEGLRMERMEKELQMREKKAKEEQRISEKQAKEKKEKENNDLAELLK